MIQHPDIEVQLTGQDSNAFNIIALVTRALKDNGLRSEAKAFSSAAMRQESHDAVIQLAMRTVTVS
jgi:hypothetical protein